MTSGRIRGLSARQAATCETAKTTRCRCRCGGRLHGSGRFTQPEDALTLAEDDPHFAEPPRRRDPMPEAEPFTETEQLELF